MKLKFLNKLTLYIIYTWNIIEFRKSQLANASLSRRNDTAILNIQSWTYGLKLLHSVISIMWLLTGALEELDFNNRFYPHPIEANIYLTVYCLVVVNFLSCRETLIQCDEILRLLKLYFRCVIIFKDILIGSMLIISSLLNENMRAIARDKF